MFESCLQLGWNFWKIAAKIALERLRKDNEIAVVYTYYYRNYIGERNKHPIREKTRK